jgi:hypothetical protein
MIATTSLYPHFPLQLVANKEQKMDESLISVIDATVRAILVIDDHPMGGLIVCIIVLAVVSLMSGRSKSS